MSGAKKELFLFVVVQFVGTLSKMESVGFFLRPKFNPILHSSSFTSFPVALRETK